MLLFVLMFTAHILNIVLWFVALVHFRTLVTLRRVRVRVRVRAV